MGTILLDMYARKTGLDGLEAKVEQAILLAWYRVKTTRELDFTVAQISDLFVRLSLPRPNPTRLKTDLNQSPDVVRGPAAGFFRLHRHRVLALEQQYGSFFTAEVNPSVVERADITNTPQLRAPDIAAARQMAELYIILYCYENSARKVIEETLSKRLGPTWWDQSANRQMKEKLADRKAKEGRARWISPRGTSPLFYMDWGDLLSLIHKYQAEFQQVFGDYTFVESRFVEMERFRNIVAHHGALTSQDDFDHVVLSFRQWCKQVG